MVAPKDPRDKTSCWNCHWLRILPSKSLKRFFRCHHRLCMMPDAHDRRSSYCSHHHEISIKCLFLDVSRHPRIFIPNNQRKTQSWQCVHRKRTTNSASPSPRRYYVRIHGMLPSPCQRCGGCSSGTGAVWNELQWLPHGRSEFCQTK